MDLIRRLLAFALALGAMFSVLVWACYFAMDNPFFASLSLPVKATDFPGSPLVGPLVAAGLGIGLAYVIYPAAKDRR